MPITYSHTPAYRCGGIQQRNPVLRALRLHQKRRRKPDVYNGIVDVILKSLFRTLNGGYHLVAPSVKLWVKHLTFFVAHYIVDNDARTLVE